MSTINRDRGFGRSLLTGIGLSAALLLSACADNPPGSYQEAIIRANPSEVQHDLFFQPGSGQLARGEAGRINQQLRALVLRPSDDIVVTLGSTGFPVIDAQREAAIRSVMASSPARLRIDKRPGFPLAARERRDVALVQIERFSELRVVCPNQGRDFSDDLFARREITMGCTNAANLASMVAEPRDLTAPGSLRKASSTADVAAVQRYREDRVKQPAAISVVGN